MGEGKVAIWLVDGKLKTQMELSPKITNGEICQIITSVNLLSKKLLEVYEKRVKKNEN